MSYCPECLKKDVRIFDLKARIKALQAKLEYQERSGLEAPFGSSTPSAKLPIKPNTPAEERRRRGGGKPGHVGHGRRDCPKAEADRVETILAGDHCPHCGTALETKGTRSRTVLDCQPLTLEKIVLRLEEKRCPRCHKKVRAKPANVLPRCLFGNQFLTHVAVEHYVRGITLGQLERQLGVGYSSLIAALHFLAGRFESVPERLVKVFRQAPVKHADETGWRNDGHNGYAWLFATSDISLFRFRNTRSASVARELFGDRKLPGVLVVDRYNAYNRMPCGLQYCYAHLLRDVQDLEKEFPDNPEIRAFVSALAPLLAGAMHLRTLRLTRALFRQQAHQIQKDIRAVVNAPAHHPAIQGIQNLFREKWPRLFHWTRNPTIPADNNFVERELRPLVIARKISFGSQSDAGAKTREILMSVLLTLKKRSPDVAAAFKAALDQLAAQPDADPYRILFPSNSS